MCRLRAIIVIFGMIATGNHCDFEFAARSTTPFSVCQKTFWRGSIQGSPVQGELARRKP